MWLKFGCVSQDVHMHVGGSSTVETDLGGRQRRGAEDELRQSSLQLPSSSKEHRGVQQIRIWSWPPRLLWKYFCQGRGLNTFSANSSLACYINFQYLDTGYVGFHLYPCPTWHFNVRSRSHIQKQLVSRQECCTYPKGNEEQNMIKWFGTMTPPQVCRRRGKLGSARQSRRTKAAEVERPPPLN